MKNVFQILDNRDRENSYIYDLQNGEKINLTLVLFCMRNTSLQIMVRLAENAEFDGRIAIIASGTHDIFVDYLATHSGENSKSNFLVRGVLANGIKKQTKMKISFRPSAINAIGNENERITLLDDSCQNICMPIIESSEENMKGSHGMSSGKINSDIYNYLASRGLGDNQIRHLVARSDILSILGNADENQLQLISEKFDNFYEQNHA